jgi:hypothetical protein
MIADSVCCFALPSVLSGPMNSSGKLVDRYRGISGGLAFAMATVASLALAIVCGVFGGFAGMYLYDRGMSKGDDFAVSIGGFFAVGTFIFVVVFTCLQKVHHPISSRTPLFALCACLVFPVVDTVLSANVMDDHYLPFVVGDWLAILFSGSLSLFVCRRWWHDSEQGF